MSTLTPRIAKAAQFLGVTPEVLTAILNAGGISNDDLGKEILDAEYTTTEILKGIFFSQAGELKDLPVLRISAAINTLKTSDKAPVAALPPVTDTVASTVLAALQANKRPAEMKDRELLEAFIQDRDPEVEQELAKRANNRRFIVLVPGKYEPGKEVIDVEKSLQLLKMARKNEVPTMAPFEGTVLQVYRITELNPEERKTEICPFCGQALFQGYCEKCELDFGGIGMDERAYLKLITDKPSFKCESHSDRKAAHASAIKGLEDLKKTWPSVVQEFEDKKLTNTLPQLVFMKPTPSTRKMDPFAVASNRSY
jgi:hypothetical protein